MSPDPSLDFDGLRPPASGLTEDYDEWRQKLRRFVESEIAPGIGEWNRSGTFPDGLYRKASTAGILGMGFPASLGGTLENARLYHRIIMAEEMHRLGSGVVFADLATLWIGLPPIARQGNLRLDEAVVKPVLAGEKKIAFAVTEPGGGSDLSRMTTAAEKTADGWLVNGEKTLISGALRADYVLTAVRTGGKGMSGISLMVIDTSSAGVTREPVEGLRWYNASLGSIRFDQTPVPSDQLIGMENRGFFDLAAQFNIERFSGIAAALALGRVCVAEAIAFAQQRETFGKRLIDHQVVRHKLVDLIRALHAGYAYLDQCVERFETGGNPIADLCMLKVQATTTLELCAREALHILGGTAYQGAGRMERILRESRIFAIGGGTEEVLRDQAARLLKF